MSEEQTTDERRPVMEAELRLNPDDDYTGKLTGIVPGEYITNHEYAICTQLVLDILGVDLPPERVRARIWLRPRGTAVPVRVFRCVRDVEDSVFSSIVFDNRGLIRTGGRWRVIDSAYYAADRTMHHLANLPDVVRDNRNRPMFWLEIEPIGKEPADG